MNDTANVIPLADQARNYLISEVEEPMSRTGKAYEVVLYIDLNDGFGPRDFEHTGHSNRALCERFAQLFVKGIIAPRIEKRDYAPGVAKPGEPTFWLNAIDHVPHPRYDWSKAKFDALERASTATVETVALECPECGDIHDNLELERTNGKCPRKARRPKATVLGDGTPVKEGDTARFGPRMSVKEYCGKRIRIDEIRRTRVSFTFLEGPKKNESNYSIAATALVADK